MGLESASFISSLNEAWPLGSDQRLTADDHLRNIKASLKNTFPNLTGAMRATQDELNALTGVTVNVQAKLDSFSNSFSQVHARIDSDSAVLTALRNEFSQSFSQIHAQATSLAAIDTALGARIDSDSAILTALRNEFSQSFSQLHAQAVSLAAVDADMEFRLNELSLSWADSTLSYSGFNTVLTTYLRDEGNVVSAAGEVSHSDTGAYRVIGPPGVSGVSITWTAMASVPAGAKYIFARAYIVARNNYTDEWPLDLYQRVPGTAPTLSHALHAEIPVSANNRIRATGDIVIKIDSNRRFESYLWNGGLGDSVAGACSYLLLGFAK